MKKISLILLISLFVFTGCASKNKSSKIKEDTLTCTLTEEAEDIKNESKVVVYFEDDKISKYELSMDATIPEKYLNIMDTLYEQSLSSFNKYKDYEAVKITSKKGKDTIHTSMTVTASKIKENEQEIFNELLDMTSNKETLKNSFEGNSYKCN